jgi:hypothetical protein
MRIKSLAPLWPRFRIALENRLEMKHWAQTDLNECLVRPIQLTDRCARGRPAIGDSRIREAIAFIPPILSLPATGRR